MKIKKENHKIFRRKGVSKNILFAIMAGLLILLFFLVFSGKLLKGAGEIISKILGF